MIIHTVMGNRSHPEYGVASIPFPIPTEEYPRIMEMLEALEVEDVRKSDCHIAEIDDLIKLTDSLDEYAWFPEIFSDRTLGEFIVETGILDVPDELEQYMDYPLIGKEYFEKFGGSFSYSGYVVPKANLPEELLTEDHSREMEVSL